MGQGGASLTQIMVIMALMAGAMVVATREFGNRSTQDLLGKAIQSRDDLHAALTAYAALPEAIRASIALAPPQSSLRKCFESDDNLPINQANTAECISGMRYGFTLYAPGATSIEGAMAGKGPYSLTTGAPDPSIPIFYSPHGDRTACPQNVGSALAATPQCPLAATAWLIPRCGPDGTDCRMTWVDLGSSGGLRFAIGATRFEVGFEVAQGKDAAGQSIALGRVSRNVSGGTVIEGSGQLKPYSGRGRVVERCDVTMCRKPPILEIVDPTAVPEILQSHSDPGWVDQGFSVERPFIVRNIGEVAFDSVSCSVSPAVAPLPPPLSGDPNSYCVTATPGGACGTMPACMVDLKGTPDSSPTCTAYVRYMGVSARGQGARDIDRVKVTCVGTAEWNSTPPMTPPLVYTDTKDAEFQAYVPRPIHLSIDSPAAGDIVINPGLSFPGGVDFKGSGSTTFQLTNTGENGTETMSCTLQPDTSLAANEVNGVAFFSVSGCNSNLAASATCTGTVDFNGNGATGGKIHSAVLVCTGTRHDPLVDTGPGQYQSHSVTREVKVYVRTAPSLQFDPNPVDLGSVEAGTTGNSYPLLRNLGETSTSIISCSGGGSGFSGTGCAGPLLGSGSCAFTVSYNDPSCADGSTPNTSFTCSETVAPSAATLNASVTCLNPTPAPTPAGYTCYSAPSCSTAGGGDSAWSCGTAVTQPTPCAFAMDSNTSDVCPGDGYTIDPSSALSSCYPSPSATPTAVQVKFGSSFSTCYETVPGPFYMNELGNWTAAYFKAIYPDGTCELLTGNVASYVPSANCDLHFVSEFSLERGQTCSVAVTYRGVTGIGNLALGNVQVTPATAAVAVGSSYPFTATIPMGYTGSLDVTEMVTWSSEPSCTLTAPGTFRLNNAAGCSITATYTGPRSPGSARLDSISTAPGLTIVPSIYDFGATNMTSTANFTVSNNGTTPTGPLTAVLSTGAPFSIIASGTTCGSSISSLAVGGSCTVQVRFDGSNRTITPAGVVVSTGLTVGDGSASASATLRGRRLGAPVLSISGNANIGTVSSATSTTLTVTNTGDTVTGAIGMPVVTSAVTGFSRTGGTCGGSVTFLPAGSSCTINITFDPASSNATAGTQVSAAVSVTDGSASAGATVTATKASAPSGGGDGGGLMIEVSGSGGGGMAETYVKCPSTHPYFAGFVRWSLTCGGVNQSYDVASNSPSYNSGYCQMRMLTPGILGCMAGTGECGEVYGCNCIDGLSAPPAVTILCRP